MTLLRKGSRKIVVGNEEYRFIISATAKGTILLVVENGDVSGKRIEVKIESDINDFWVEFPYVEGLNLKLLKPKEVAGIIQEAVKLNWNSREKGSPLLFDWADNKLIRSQ
ncbi:hypothetical protein [Bacillus sp. FJAT-28004]|uniref:hypothetical protein n=1 Tax=Bacillus sp. FJAT-28004 TaxID=1679165 RepID=UPI0006B6724E|nr:hypothetical protein [Bacillus sp. FJAT-28004]